MAVYRKGARQNAMQEQEAKVLAAKNLQKKEKATAATAIAKYNDNPTDFNSAEKMRIYGIADKYNYSTYTGRQKEKKVEEVALWQKLGVGALGALDELVAFGFVPNEWYAGQNKELLKWARGGEWAGMGASFLLPGIGALKGLSAAGKAVKGIKYADTAAAAISAGRKIKDAKSAAKIATEASELIAKRLAKEVAERATKKAGKEIAEKSSKELVESAIQTIVKGNKTNKFIGSSKTAGELLDSVKDIVKQGKVIQGQADAVNAFTRGKQFIHQASKLGKFTPMGNVRNVMTPSYYGMPKEVAKDYIPKILATLPEAQKIPFMKYLLKAFPHLASVDRKVLTPAYQKGTGKSEWERYLEMKEASLLGGGNVPTRR